MTLLHRLASVLRWIFRRDRAEQRLDDELQAFVEMSAAEKVRDGLPPAEARRLAILELGGDRTGEGTGPHLPPRRAARRGRARRALCLSHVRSGIPASPQSSC